MRFAQTYATEQFEGYVPNRKPTRCDLLSVGGVCGNVTSQHAAVRSPTRLSVVGQICDPDGRPLNQRAFGLPLAAFEPTAEVILVVGATMNSGKTTIVGTLARALSRAGLRVAAAKVTGTAASRDGRIYRSSGADPVLDFVDAGYPSTYMLEQGQIMMLYSVLLSQLQAARPDYIILEVADGLFQRETRMLLADDGFRATINHVFFAANDSLSAESGVRHLRAQGLPIRATSGLLTRSPLGMREAEEITGVPCLSPGRMIEGDALELVDARNKLPQPGVLTSIKPLSRGAVARNGHLLPKGATLGAS